MTEIFKFKKQQVRVLGSIDRPWWVGKDICDVLDISKYRDALARLDEDERCPIEVDTLGGKQEMTCINESGLYSLILSSRKPQAKEFKKWITSEVLPAIRQTGSYSITNQNPNSNSRLAEDLMLADYAARSAQNAGVDKNIVEQIKLESLMKIYPERENILKPQKKAIASANPLQQKALSPTEVGQELAERLRVDKISAQAINKKLIQLGYQVSVKRKKKTTGKIVHDYYQATEKGEVYSQLEMTAYKVSNDGNSTKYQLRWLSGIIDVLLSEWAK